MWTSRDDDEEENERISHHQSCTVLTISTRSSLCARSYVNLIRFQSDFLALVSDFKVLSQTTVIRRLLQILWSSERWRDTTTIQQRLRTNPNVMNDKEMFWIKKMNEQEIKKVVLTHPCRASRLNRLQLLSLRRLLCRCRLLCRGGRCCRMIAWRSHFLCSRIWSSRTIGCHWNGSCCCGCLICSRSWVFGYCLKCRSHHTHFNCSLKVLFSHSINNISVCLRSNNWASNFQFKLNKVLQEIQTERREMED